MLEGDGLASQQTCSLLGAGSALETLTCVQSHSMSDPKKYPSKPGVADCKSDLTIHDAVTEVLAPKFDATAGFQPTVLS